MATGHLTQRTPGSWTLVINLGRDPATGKRKQKWKTIRGTKRQAQAELTRLLAEIQSGGFAPPEKVTVGEFLLRWLETKKGRIRPGTVESYEKQIRNHLIPGLGA